MNKGWLDSWGINKDWVKANEACQVIYNASMSGSVSLRQQISSTTETVAVKLPAPIVGAQIVYWGLTAWPQRSLRKDKPIAENQKPSDLVHVWVSHHNLPLSCILHARYHFPLRPIVVYICDHCTIQSTLSAPFHFSHMQWPVEILSKHARFTNLLF